MNQAGRFGLSLVDSSENKKRNMAEFAADIFIRFRYQYNVFLAERLKLLLETKHLYQKVSISPTDVRAQLRERVMQVGDERGTFDRLVDGLLGLRFSLAEKQLFDPQKLPIPMFSVSNVKLYCSACGTREAYRPIWFSDITEELIRQQERLKIAFHKDFQLFYIVYQCQHCEGVPEVFLVKRMGLDLFIEGRSPIENLEIPQYIPKQEMSFFRDALIAFQTGKTLAALFYLRTFIEQFARRKTNLQDERVTGEEIMSAYAQLLPTHLRDSMPSLREWYDKLSVCLHTAKENSAVFDSAKQSIQKHFDIRRVHDLD